MFLITGLQLRTLLPSIRHYTLAEIGLAAVVVCMVVIVARFIWMYPATYVPRWLFPALRRRDPYPPWQHPTLLAFTGNPRHRLARRGARDPVHRRRRESIPRPGSHPHPDLLRDLRHAGRRRP